MSSNGVPEEKRAKLELDAKGEDADPKPRSFTIDDKEFQAAVEQIGLSSKFAVMLYKSVSNSWFKMCP